MRRFLLIWIITGLLISFFPFYSSGQPIQILGISKTDETCSDTQDGTITISVTGGTKPYVFNIIHGVESYNSPELTDTVYTFTDVWATSWIILVEDDLNNPAVGSIIVNEPDPVGVQSELITPITCTGFGDGIITVIGKGESGSYQYTLNPGGVVNNSGIFNGLDPGSYTVDILDAAGCPTSITSSSLVISDPLPLSVNTATATDIVCHGLGNGVISASGGGGTGSYIYTLNPGAVSTNTTGSFTNLQPGLYSVNITDNNSCPSVNTVPLTVNEPPELTVEVSSKTDILCFGSPAGSASVTGSGGTGSYTFNIDGGPFDPSGSFPGLTAGMHTVQVRDASLCTASTTFDITQPASAVTGSIIDQTNLLCAGTGSGSVTVSGSGGTGVVYTFNIDGGPFSLSGSFSGLSTGVHSVQVKDENNCVDDVPVNITEPAPVSGSISSQTDVPCFGASTGSVTILGSGGTVPYSYSLEGGSFVSPGVFTGLTAGNYTVSIKDANDCTSDMPITISQPADAVAIILIGKTDLLCNAVPGGSISVNATGGTVPYTFNIDGGAYDVSGTFNSLTAGTHTLEARDANGCLSPLDVDLTEPDALLMDLAVTNITCKGAANGSVSISASGGTSPYSYSKLPDPYQVSDTYLNLAPSTYTFNTLDANGCIASKVATVLEPAALQIPSEIMIDNNICFGDSLGEIRILLVTGGTSPYEYSVDNGLNFSTSGIFQNLTAGSYTTVVKDANGCLKTGKVNTISQPAKMMIISYAEVDVSGCFGGSNGQISILAGGGTAPYNYDLDGIDSNQTGLFTGVGGGNHLITMTDSKSCSIDTSIVVAQPVEMIFSGLVITDVSGCSGDSNGIVNAVASGGAGSYEYSFEGGGFQSSGLFSALSAGSYDLTVRDANMCLKDTIVMVNEPGILNILNITQVNISCNNSGDGSINVTPTGGTLPYTFVLNPGAVQTNNTGSFNFLVPGTYSVSLDDSEGCGPVNSVSVTITEPDALVRDSVGIDSISCSGSADSEIRIYTSGGTIPYSYSINNGSTFQDSLLFTNISPGVYYLSIRDSQDCQLQMDTITVVDPPAILSLEESWIDITSCSYAPEGEVRFIATGGTGDLEYSIDLLNWQDSGRFTGLDAGVYTVTARDAKLCTLATSDLAVSSPGEIDADIIAAAFLNDLNPGSITISNPSGGTGTLNFSITGQTGTFSTQTIYTGLLPGSYTVVIRDENNCFLEEMVIISEIPSLEVTFTVTSSVCFGDNDGTITMVSPNATPPVFYSIDDSATWIDTGHFTGLSPGNYYIFLRDGQNRYFQDTVLITEPLELRIFGSVSPASCNSFAEDGSINIIMSGGTLPYSFLWNTGAISQNLSSLPPGDYSLEVTDSENCRVQESFNLPAITIVNANAGQDTALCPGEPLILNGLGGSIVSWSPVEGLSNPNIPNPVVSITEDASYVFTVTGFNDCYDTDTINIIKRPDLGIFAGNDTTIIKGREVTLTASGGDFVSYSWTPASGLSAPNEQVTTAIPTATTNYVIIAESEWGCKESDTIKVTIAERIVVYDVFSPNNGDDLNNYFDIGNADFYPEMVVEVFSRWGEKLFSSSGYSDDQRWDGTFKGKDVPVGTYYYVIIPYSGADPITGPLTIVR